MEMFNYAKENIANIHFFYISDEEICINIANYNLEKRYENCNKFYGIRSMHQFLPTSLSSFIMKRFSEDIFTKEIILTDSIASSYSIQDVSVGIYIGCIYDNN